MSFPRRVRWTEGRYANVDGIPFQMPVGTRTSPALFAGFSIDVAAAQELLPGEELHACRVWNRGMLMTAVVDYQDTPIGRYVEFCIGILCTRGPAPAPPLLPLTMLPPFGTGVYIYDLPVSSEVSVKGGRGIWGMAKRQANLDYVMGDETVSSQYDLDGQLVMRIDVPRTTATVPMSMKGVGYGDFRGMLTKSTVYLKARWEMAMRPASARLLVGDHARAEPLKRLDMDPRPLFTGFAPRIEAVLDDHVESWFLTAGHPLPEPIQGMADAIDLTLSQDWLAPPDRATSDRLLTELSPEQAVGRAPRPPLSPVTAGEQRSAS